MGGGRVAFGSLPNPKGETINHTTKGGTLCSRRVNPTKSKTNYTIMKNKLIIKGEKL